MTYRNKLLLKRTLIILAIVAAVVAVLLLIGFTYLGRYVVYTEDGAYFSFNSQPPVVSEGGTVAELPSNIELVTGEPISTNETIGDSETALADTDVHGYLVDYATLADGTTLNEIDLTAEVCNTLVLEMRSADQPLLTTQAVTELIDRAKIQDTWLVAMVSCLSDSEYALENMDQAIRISGGALWMSSSGSYWLDPGQEPVIQYVADLIQQLADMGFDEVILNDFSLPTGDSVDYDYGDSTSTDIMLAAYNNLLDATMDSCKLSLYIEDPASGHQAFDAADRIYVYMDDGGSVKDYAENHPDQYLVFITDSHDTRFDDYGKVEIIGDFGSDAPVQTAPEDDAEGTDEDEETPPDEESPEDGDTE